MKADNRIGSKKMRLSALYIAQKIYYTRQMQRIN